MKRLFRKRIVKIILFIAAVFVVIVLINFVTKDTSTSNSNKFSSSESNSSNTPTVEVNKEFTFDGVNKDEEDVPVKFTVVQAERKTEVKVKGESRQPSEGKDFLLIRIELQNDRKERIAFATADHVRLEENGKLYAPDYHNGNVVIDPISVRKDLVAFVVNEKAKSFRFQIGELDGEKEVVEINF